MTLAGRCFLRVGRFAWHGAVACNRSAGRNGPLGVRSFLFFEAKEQISWEPKGKKFGLIKGLLTI